MYLLKRHLKTSFSSSFLYSDTLNQGRGTRSAGAYHSPGVGVLFEWHPRRAAKCLAPMLSGYQGLLQSDGYVGYTRWLNDPKHAVEKRQITHAACWAHARRKFVETSHPIAGEVVKLIAKLYRIETKLREECSDNRCATREAQAAPPCPKVHLGKAIHYTFERWDMLNEYLDPLAFEIDNNLVENAIRPTAIGKKNGLFFGSPNSGQDSAILYSLIETCRKLGINPAEYLRELFEALPKIEQKEIPDWTPAQWEASRKAQSVPEKTYPIARSRRWPKRRIQIFVAQGGGALKRRIVRAGRIPSEGGAWRR